MIDREARTELCQAVDDFLFDRIGSEAFDAEIQSLYRETPDQTVRHVISQLWLTYSDMEDHLVRYDRRTWKSVQRLVLLLTSNAEIEFHRSWQWHPSQLMAGAGLAKTALWVPVNFVLALVIAGVTANTVGRHRRRLKSSDSERDPWHAWPFPSLAALARTLQANPQFQRRPYRPELPSRIPKVPWYDDLHLPRVIEVPLAAVGWCIVAPLVLLVQCLPLCRVREAFVEPHQRAVQGR